MEFLLKLGKAHHIVERKVTVFFLHFYEETIGIKIIALSEYICEIYIEKVLQ